jgi:hypothetical protein
LVKWKGYPHEESTWEPEANLEHAPKAVKDFYIKHPAAPRKISALTFSRLPFQTYENLTELSSSHQHPYGTGQTLMHIVENVP